MHDGPFLKYLQIRRELRGVSDIAPRHLRRCEMLVVPLQGEVQ